MIKQLIKFSMVGILNTLITFITYAFLVHYHIDIVIANSTGYILGMINSFFFNNFWVFKSKNANKDSVNPSIVLKFIIVNLITLLLSNFLLNTIVEKMAFDKIFAQAIVIPVTMIFNFLLNKFWTFERKENI